MTPVQLQHHNTMVINAVLNSLIDHFVAMGDFNEVVEFRSPDIAKHINEYRHYFHSTTEARLNQLYTALRQPLQPPATQKPDSV